MIIYELIHELQQYFNIKFIKVSSHTVHILMKIMKLMKEQRKQQNKLLPGKLMKSEICGIRI